MLVFILVIFYPRRKFQFIWWGLDKCYDKEIDGSMCDKMRQTLNKILETYSLFLSKGQAESVAQEIELSEFVIFSYHMGGQFEKDMDQDSNLNKNKMNLYLMKTRRKNFHILISWIGGR